VAAAWAQELDRRSREISEGKVQPVDWETARTQILNEMRQLVQVDLHPEAQSELRRAALWHDQQRAGLGDELFADVNVADIYITGAPSCCFGHLGA